MKKHLITFLLILWAGIVSSQQNINYITAGINGMQFSVGSKANLLLYKQNYSSISYLPDSVITTPIDSSGTFKFRFSSAELIFYIGLQLFNGDKRLNLSRNFVKNPLLSEQGDSIKIDLKISQANDGFTYNNTAWFSGKGADKYNMQYLINRYEEPMEARGPFYMDGPFSTAEPLSAKEKVYLMHQQYRLSIVDTFKGRVKEDILNRVRRNIIAQSKYWFTNTFLWGSYVMGNESEQMAVATFLKAGQRSDGLFSHTDELIGARGYTDFILLAEELQYRIKHNINWKSETKRLPAKEYSQWMYTNLKSKYSGSVRESLITDWLTKPEVLRDYFPYLKAAYSEAMTIVKDSGNRAILVKAISQFEGKQIFPFKFIDKESNFHTSDRYSDKIMVLDFWFTGCSGCTQIPPVMKIIMNQFKQQKDVVFLSISTDTQKSIWEKGIASGLYTVPGQIHLKTINAGRIDPFILHYKFSAYPQLMVIGKGGKLVAVNPVDPRIDQGKNIISLIEEELKHK